MRHKPDLNMPFCIVSFAWFVTVDFFVMFERPLELGAEAANLVASLMCLCIWGYQVHEQLVVQDRELTTGQMLAGCAIVGGAMWLPLFRITAPMLAAGSFALLALAITGACLSTNAARVGRRASRRQSGWPGRPSA